MNSRAELDRRPVVQRPRRPDTPAESDQLSLGQHQQARDHDRRSPMIHDVGYNFGHGADMQSTAAFVVFESFMRRYGRMDFP